MNTIPTINVMVTTGGTGGHIFPGIAVARAIEDLGHRVFWVGTESGLESKLVPEAKIAFEALSFRGVRGKGWRTTLKAPFALTAAVLKSMSIIKRRRPDVVIGFGGFASFPGVLAALFKRVPVVIHESNAVVGLANKVLAKKAAHVMVGFKGVLDEGNNPRVTYSGNPVRDQMLSQKKPDDRFKNRTGVLHLLVVGGSLGARVINETVPRALALLPEEVRPTVTHQSGHRHLEALKAQYQEAKVKATCVPFIEDMGEAYARADVVVCRGGSMTVSELTAVGAASVIVPFAGAIADEQSANADGLVHVGAAQKIPQNEFTPEVLADFIKNISREQLRGMANAAYQCRSADAQNKIAAVCIDLGLQYHERQGGRDAA
ncbi:MAG: undecaprenyldiphospho-muramoylpentapeptide beta-N-acetylglucosaminyltransferase [Burkholderiales bacterium]|jgi:UDP-N-acetylglucosamine--N-acetylmuramyl-(pentapeptide) pyrophosphoryl-undecaprenol N-acetylglucosamine transferase|nr:undecaprenyldiphospho-muramoylpentapeptide beta-N-acetylglucosaminyltransferase [Burkholderiales bacterium]